MPAVMPGQQPVHQQAAAAVQKPAQNRNAAPAANEPRKVKFSVGRDYQVMTVIGEGAYGVVVRAVHRASGREVAIKKVSNASGYTSLFVTTTPKRRLIQRL